MISGIGSTVIVKDIGGPGQLDKVVAKWGITVIVAITG